MAKRHVSRLGGLAASVLVGFTFLGLVPSRSTTIPSLASRAYGGEAVLASDLDNAADTLELAGLQSRFEAISRKVAPSVVSISAACCTVDNTDTLRTDTLNHEKLEGILERTTRMVGTGFVIDAEGYILTNEHVVGEAESVWITTDDRKVYPAVVVGSDPRADLAVLKVPAHGLRPVRFAPYNSVKRGQWAIAIGNPYGLATEGEQCMSVGVVSALDRSLPKLSKKENRLYSNLIQTTAQINPGNSGGPLFDLNGDVIGVNTAVILPEKRTNGIGFAMPISPQVVQTIHDLREGREVVYGYLGVMVSTPTDHDRQLAGIREPVGVRVDGVEGDSPASEASRIKERDVIVQINGEIIHDSDHFVRIIGTAGVDRPAKISLYRDGKVIQTELTLRRRQLATAGVTRESRRFRWQGMLLGPIPANWTPPAGADPARPTGGLMVIGISENSPFAKEHIGQGDIITSVAGKAVADILQLQQILNEVPASMCSQLGVAGRQKTVVLGD
jgi:S1-C subfamily serine protease